MFRVVQVAEPLDHEALQVVARHCSSPRLDVDSTHRTTSGQEPGHDSNREHDDEDVKQDLGNAGGRRGNASESEERCYQRKNQKREGPLKHVSSLERSEAQECSSLR